MAGHQICNLALARLIFIGTKQLGGNGFVTVFIAGILFGYVSRHLLGKAAEYPEISGTIYSGKIQ